MAPQCRSLVTYVHSSSCPFAVSGTCLVEFIASSVVSDK